MRRLGRIMREILGMGILIAALYASWNGGYYGVKLLSGHFEWSLSPYGSGLLVMALQFLILLVVGGTTALIGHARGMREHSIFPS